MSHVGRRRYLTDFDVHRLPHLFTDVLVIGAGVGGLRAAIAARQRGAKVLVVAKGGRSDSSTAWAQGGIAAAIHDSDSPEQHARDTITVACGLGHERVIRSVMEEAPAHIRELVEWGAQFDTDNGVLASGQEGAHSARRIVHAHGDATGREIAETLTRTAVGEMGIRLFEQCFVIDLLSDDHRVVGAITYHPKYGHQMFWARTTILASGGVGRVYRETTNPPVATGDGLAMGFRAGAALRDVEMIQFHPTTLYVAGAARALISEAVRGEGGYLRNRAGERFMERYDERGELASRDVVSRAIATEMEQEGSTHVFLDVRHFEPGRFEARFPTISKLCRDFDLDPANDLIPVRPSAHYSVGGLVTDESGQTSVDGLLACGEVASTGLHGANRLASNSLLEGLVFGRRAGQLAAELAAQSPAIERPVPLSHVLPPSPRTELDLDDVRHSLQSLMSRNVGIERSADRLRETIEIVEFWSRYVLDKVFDEPRAWETQNLLTVACCIATGAATRCESRGVHFRADFPEPDDAHWRCHIDIRRVEDDVRTATSPLPERDDSDEAGRR